MFRQSPRRHQRSTGMKMKHVLQVSLLLGVSIWLFVQMQRSGNKKAPSQESLKLSEKMQQHDNDSVKFGRKDLKPKVEVYSEDEKPLETPHFEDETKPQDREQEQNMEAVQHTQNFVNSIKEDSTENYASTIKEAETEEGGVAKETHTEEHEIRETNSEDQMEDNNLKMDGGATEFNAEEGENSEHETKIDEGDNIEDEGVSVKVKKNMEKLLEKGVEVKKNIEKYLEDKAGIVGKGEDAAMGNESNENENGRTMEVNLAGEEKVSEDLQKKEKRKEKGKGKGKSGHDTQQNEEIVESKIGQNKNNVDNESKVKDKGIVSEYSTHKTTEDDANGKGSGKSNAENDKLEKQEDHPVEKNGIKEKSLDGGVVSDGTNRKSQNKKREKIAGKIKNAIEKTKNTAKMIQDAVLPSSEANSSTHGDELHSSAKMDTNSGESNSSVAHLLTKAELDMSNGNSNSSYDGNSDSDESKASRDDMENHLSVSETNTSVEPNNPGNNTVLDEKSNSYNDSNGRDDGNSSMDNFSQVSTTSSKEDNPSINETVHRMTDNESDSSLPQEVKDARTDLDTLPESGTDSNTLDASE
ncbi:uncharacterized protein LOC127240570 [Andrographis paniculata]|uniref:uncharacterized protein LOC127240570 n=1 Tax=Andrographis paniculata TaxID=175694 RepID=UPI0021E7221B|nr:uncharacterized protein LOC127240570 [Andrographis paniculata]XP_051115262.1 uncharacterized protein LOC127240570 [Andrographis paniculata]XP_051115263.1 uncharacterized protein LOC127240570 [Andrographis paniculata]